MGRIKKSSEEGIVIAALGIIEREGVDGLSMRKLATEVGVTPMLLYRYFENRDSILSACAIFVTRNISIPQKELKWQERLKEYVLAEHRAMIKYPGLTAYELENLWSEASLCYRETILSIFADGGFSPEEAIKSANIMSYFLDPFRVLTNRVADERRMKATHHNMEAAIAGREAQFPNIARHLPYMWPSSLDMGAALDRMISGLDALRGS